MKLSTRARYGTRAMVELAAAAPHKPLSTQEVARSQRLSVKYLEQILAPLKAAGLIKAVRGVHGGHALARPAGEINLLDIYTAIEGAPVLVECVADSGSCPASCSCPTRDTWLQMNDAIQSILGKTTLQDLLERGRSKNRPGVAGKK